RGQGQACEEARARRAATSRAAGQVQAEHLSRVLGSLAMGFGARSGIVVGAAMLLVLLLLGSPAAAQDAKPKTDYLKNIELCNGAGRASPDVRIEGCTALIGTTQA